MTITSARPPVKDSLPVEPGLSLRNQRKAHALGLTSATGLVVGSIVGTGVFTMPAVIAGAGTSVVFDQAENRLHTIKAAMVATLEEPREARTR